VKRKFPDLGREDFLVRAARSQFPKCPVNSVAPLMTSLPESLLDVQAPKLG
jgi:hypothetical protein